MERNVERNNSINDDELKIILTMVLDEIIVELKDD